MRRLGAHLVFLDESGFLMAPHVARTWGLRGRTPVLMHRASNRQRVSLIAALSVSPRRKRLGLHFQTHANKSVDQAAVIGFLRGLLRDLRGPVVLVWDNISSHRGKLVRGFIAKHPRLHAEPLPPYAPELNPVEWNFERTKCHDLANHGLSDLGELDRRVRASTRRTGRSQPKLRSFIHASHLPMRI